MPTPPVRPSTPLQVAARAAEWRTRQARLGRLTLTPHEVTRAEVEAREEHALRERDTRATIRAVFGFCPTRTTAAQRARIAAYHGGR